MKIKLVLIRNIRLASRPNSRQIEDAVNKIVAKLKKKPLGARPKKLLSKSRELTLVLTTKSKMRRLNREYRGKDKPTDILSFTGIEALSLGELVVCVPVVRSDARRHKITYNENLLYLLIHGILHLLGFDHETNDKAARRMYALQDFIFEEMRTKWP